MDDIEFGCGGTISKYSTISNFKILVLTANRKSYHGEIQEERDVNEQKEAVKCLGLNANDIEINYEIAGQMFPEHRQLVLEELYRVKKEFNPDIVFVPSHNDVHQDHKTVAFSAFKTFKRETLIGYEIINSSCGFNPNLYIQLSENDICRKAKAIGCYRSQNDGETTTSDYFSENTIKSLAITRGARYGTAYAEGFELYHMFL